MNTKPTRRLIQPEAVIEAALHILDHEGLDGVTLRRLASKLGVQAPSLYRHFKNKQDIMDGMAQEMLTHGLPDLAPPTHVHEWMEWMSQKAHSLRHALLSRREGARVVAGARLDRAVALAELSELIMRVLREAGFDLLSAHIACTTVITYTFGFVIEEQAGMDVDPDTWKDILLNPRSQMIEAALLVHQTIGTTEAFNRGLQLILTGLKAQLAHVEK